MKSALLVLLSGSFLFFASAGDTLTQISTISALLTGVYDGQTPLSALKQSGDFGIGTFNGLDGEMVLIDDTVFRVDASGAVSRPGGEVRTPFAAVTHFHAGRAVDLAPGAALLQAERMLDSALPTQNLFYAVKISGVFRNVKIRSVPRQEPPYRPMREVVKKQSVFALDSVQGTIIGFRCPAYASAINVAGYHFHFLSSDRTRGGHVLDFTTGQCRAEVDRLSAVKLLLPEDTAFYRADLSGCNEAEVKRVER